MKTYKLKTPFKRNLEGQNIPYEEVLFRDSWLVFDEHHMDLSVTFHRDGTFKLSRTLLGRQRESPSGESCHGEWSYDGGDRFHLSMDGGVFGLHLVHLDSNLMVFELHDTKEYCIFVSETCQKALCFNSLDAIDYYIGKLQSEVTERLRSPNSFGGKVVPVIPILVMGGQYHSLMWHHDQFDEHKESDKKDLHSGEACWDEYDEEAEDNILTDENNEFYDEDDLELEEEDLEEEDLEEPQYIVSPYDESYDDPIYEDSYDDYGGLSEEEVIYDYLESQDDE